MKKTDPTCPEVSIRPLRLDDAPAVQRYASDERVARNTTIPEPYPKDGGETFVKHAIEARRKRETFFFAIIVDRETIGVVELGAIDEENRSIQCDYAIAASHWGNGIATKAVMLAVRYAFCELDMKVIRSGCLNRNPASARVLEKNGFRETEGFVFDRGKFKNEPARSFRLTKQDWLIH